VRRVERAEHARAGRSGRRRDVAGRPSQEGAGQPGERRRLDLLFRNALRAACDHRHRRQRACQSPHEIGIAGAAAADHELDRRRRMATAGVADDAGGELRQRRLDVLRAQAGSSVGVVEPEVEPSRVEEVEARALRRRQGEVRLGKKGIE